MKDVHRGLLKPNILKERIVHMRASRLREGCKMYIENLLDPTPKSEGREMEKKGSGGGGSTRGCLTQLGHWRSVPPIPFPSLASSSQLLSRACIHLLVPVPSWRWLAVPFATHARSAAPSGTGLVARGLTCLAVKLCRMALVCLRIDSTAGSS